MIMAAEWKRADLHIRCKQVSFVKWKIVRFISKVSVVTGKVQ